MEIFPYGDVKGRVLTYILDRPTARVRVSRIAEKVGASKGHVSEVISGLKREGIIRKDMVDLKNPYVRSLKIAINVNKISRGGIIPILKTLNPEGAGLYGSWANGTNTEESDIDMWVKTEDAVSALKKAELRSRIGKILGVEPQIIMLGEEQIKKLKDGNEVFYFSLLMGSIVLFGENVGRA
ncbi:MAG: nucleotidyltransferase domain-containing protein [Candidatus Micrarchaeota archaeon]|nr:nucleotidyltransferase domain-containing protein [Candidatus Micrarchaeota archaeon]